MSIVLHGATLCGSTLHAARELKGFGWHDVALDRCAFQGRFLGNDFGSRPDAHRPPRRTRARVELDALIARARAREAEGGHHPGAGLSAGAPAVAQEVPEGLTTPTFRGLPGGGGPVAAR